MRDRDTHLRPCGHPLRGLWPSRSAEVELLQQPVDKHAALGGAHLRCFAGLCRHRGQPQHETRQRRTGPIIGRRPGGEAAGELIVAAILKESPHGPDVPAVAGAEFHAVPSVLPAHRIAAFDDRVPRVHRRGQETIAECRVTLHVEERRPVGARPAEADTLNCCETMSLV